MTPLLRGNGLGLALPAFSAEHLTPDDAQPPEMAGDGRGCLYAVFQGPTERARVAGCAIQPFGQFVDTFFEIVQPLWGTPDPLPRRPLVQETQNAF